MARKKQLRAGVIGCGAIAQHCHLPGYAKEDNCELVAVADPSRVRGKALQEEFGVANYYPKWEKMLEKEELDVVSICTPNAFHAAQAIAALNKGINVLCEKPLCLNMCEAKRIQKAHQKSGVVFMTGFTHRFMAGNIKAKKVLERGDIGEPFMFRCRFAHTGPQPGWAHSRWFYDKPKAGGGALLDMGIHAIDIAHFLLGPIQSVSASIGTLIKKIDVDDNAVMALEFEENMLGYIEVGWTSPSGFAGVEINGTEGSIVVDYKGVASVERGKNLPDGTRTLKSRTLAKNPTDGGWAVEVGEFLKYVRKGVEPPESLQAGIDALAVALAVDRSAKEGRKVTVKEIKG